MKKRDRTGFNYSFLKSCSICGKNYFKPLFSSHKRWAASRFCSLTCAGKHHGITHQGKNNHLWKETGLEKPGMHERIKKNYGIPDHCDICGKKANKNLKTVCGKKFKRNPFEWSNRTNIYTADAQNWWMLCASCHRKHDVLVQGVIFGRTPIDKTFPCKRCKEPVNFYGKKPKRTYCGRSCRHLDSKQHLLKSKTRKCFGCK